MQLIGQILTGIGGLGSLICFILIIVKMFQSGASGIAITCLVLLFCCGIGGLVAFVFGWIKNKEWNVTNIMAIWSVCIVLSIIGNVLAPTDLSQFQQLTR